MIWLLVILGLIGAAILAAALFPRPLAGWLWQVYGNVYDGLNRFWPYRNLLDLVQERVRLQPGMRLLDLGCGTGNILQRTMQVTDVTGVGVDLSRSMLRVAKRKLSSEIAAGRLVLQESEVLEYLVQAPSGSFDRVVLVNILYAMEGRERLWRELLRVLKDDGLIVATTSVRPGSWPIIKEHFKNDHWWRLLSPKLLGVFIVDSFINLLGRTKHFGFPDTEKLRREVEAAGGKFIDPIICYGGDRDGVNVLFSASH